MLSGYILTYKMLSLYILTTVLIMLIQRIAPTQSRKRAFKFGIENGDFYIFFLLASTKLVWYNQHNSDLVFLTSLFTLFHLLFLIKNYSIHNIITYSFYGYLYLWEVKYFRILLHFIWYLCT